MNTTRILQTVLTAALIFAGASAAQAADPVYKTFFGDKAIGGYDPVGYHESKRAIKGSKKHRYAWKGANWHFSSAANLAKFKSDPDRYAPQYGGYCAWAVAEADKLVKIDPEVFDLVEGKLYLNYSKKTQKDWRADRASMIQRGDANYPKLIAK